MKRNQMSSQQPGNQTERTNKNQELDNLAHSNTLLRELYIHARKRQARALHDGPTQSIAALAMQINYARRLMEKDPQAALAELKEIEDLARRTTIEMRQILYTLHPLALESGGVFSALESLAEKTGKTFDQKIETDFTADRSLQLDNFAGYLVFSMAVEALNNACEHAQAEKVILRLAINDGSAVLEVEDDGIGFDPQETEPQSRNNPTPGLRVMHEYAELLQGELETFSHRGEGTRVSCRFPAASKTAENE